MASKKEVFDSIISRIRKHQEDGEVSEFSINYVGEIPKIRLRAVGAGEWIAGLKNELLAMDPTAEFIEGTQRQAYYFLSGDLRPGSGVVRFFAGKPEGPSGTLTCLLSSKDHCDLYFAAAAHVLSDFWEDWPDPTGSIYRSRKGFPATNSQRFLGKLIHLSCRPEPLRRMGDCEEEGEIFKDIGICKLEGDFDWRQRTTCYGSFGEWPPGRPKRLKEGLEVTKCGAEEKHSTDAFIERACENVTVYGPDGVRYELKGQVVLAETPDTAMKAKRSEEQQCAERSPGEQEGSAEQPAKSWHCDQPPRIPFAVPGDSGTMVVYKKSKRPVGMLIAGSILDGRYVVTPIRPLVDFWERRGLVLLRG